MDSELLVEQKDDGRKLVEQLARDGFEVAAAFWILRHGRVSWELYIASPLVDGQNSNEAYRRLIPSIAKVPSKWVTISDLDLLNPENPIVKAAVEIRDRDPDGRAVSYEGGRLGDLAIQGAYIYPEIAPARLFFIVQYDRGDHTNEWNAKVEYVTSYENMRLRGAVGYSTATRDGDSPADPGGALVGALVEIDPKFVPFSPRDRQDILAVASRQARAAADGMFKSHHPEAVVESADEHCLAS
ncbi:MAG: hypothetical protein P4L85_23855 [Paludisphaera borealis]|uniref:hypothetical protein n=1 Tax=Paludisphaera borealis TaxID=1387353 RepID=UPI002844CB47|nr:hypothetical protein [Paludisphaera borealis]MDR3622406.1 hypothetical protein [Paludisphaera borealis]